MKHLTYTLSIAALVGSLGTGAFAATDADAATMTCADFVAMSADEQRAALDTLNSADASTDTTDTEADADTADADAGTDLSAQTDTDVGASTDTDTDSSGAADTTVADPEVESVIAACEGDDEAFVADQIAP